MYWHLRWRQSALSCKALLSLGSWSVCSLHSFIMGRIASMVSWFKITDLRYDVLCRRRFYISFRLASLIRETWLELILNDKVSTDRSSIMQVSMKAPLRPWRLRPVWQSTEQEATEKTSNDCKDVIAKTFSRSMDQMWTIKKCPSAH